MGRRSHPPWSALTRFTEKQVQTKSPAFKGPKAGAPTTPKFQNKGRAIRPLTYTVKFGQDIGTILRPHRYKTGFRASKGKFGPHAHVQTEKELIPYLQREWGIRMSARGHSPSLITPASVNGWRKLQESN